MKKSLADAAVRILLNLATDPEQQRKARQLLGGAFDAYQVRTGQVNRHSVEEAVGIACRTCVRKDDESQTRVAAFVSGLYMQHEIHRAAQVGGSLRKRFGTAWFPRIKPREERYALEVDEELEAYLYEQATGAPAAEA